MRPSIGRIVHYKLTEAESDAVNRRRTSASSIAERIKQQVITLDHGQVPQWPLGAQAHIGNSAYAGQIVPLLIVQVWPNEYGPDFDGVNGQAFMDGNDVLWITSAREGSEQGQWVWPPRA